MVRSSWHSPKTMGRSDNPRVVVLYGGGAEHASEGVGFPSDANRVGDLEGEEC
jgi:hypothetical protein